MKLSKLPFGSSVWLVLFAGTLSFPIWASNEGSIIQVSRKLRMSVGEPLPPKDFVIDLGSRQGVKVGDVFEVVRSTSILNGITGESNNLIQITLGEIRIFLVGEFTSIGRVASETGIKNLPAIDSPWFMLGDEVHLKTSLPIQP